VLRAAGSISWPDGVVSSDPVIDVLGLVVTQPGS